MDSDGGTGNGNINKGKPKAKSGIILSPEEAEAKRARLSKKRLSRKEGRELREKAMAMYFDFHPRPAICRALGLTPAALNGWAAQGHWFKKREEMHNDVTKEIMKRRAFSMANMANLGIEAMAKSIAIVAGRKEVTLQEGQIVANILAQMDKMLRLSMGQPTERVEHKGDIGLQAVAFKTVKEIRDAIAQDPMMASIDVSPGVAGIGEQAVEAINDKRMLKEKRAFEAGEPEPLD